MTPSRDGIGGWPTFDFFVRYSRRGAPSLRFLQGWAAMLHALRDLLQRDMDNKLALVFPTPALRKRREGRGTHCFLHASEIRSPGHPPEIRTARYAVILRAARLQELPIDRPHRDLGDEGLIASDFAG
jgi:hypothetical protein